MKHLVKNSVLAALSIAFIGFGTAAYAAPSSEEQQGASNSYKFKNDYESIVGVYKGVFKIKAPAAAGDSSLAGGEIRELPGQMFVYRVTSVGGTDRTGAPVSSLQVVAQLKLDATGELDDTTFIVKFDQRSGEVEFFQVASKTPSLVSGAPTIGACPVGPKDPQLTMQGKLVDGDLEAEVNGTNGFLGRVSMKRTSSEAVQPIRDQRERLMRAFAPVVGKWSGSSKIRSGSGDAVETVTNIFIYADEVAAGPGLTCPTLRAQIRLPEAVGQLEDTFMNVVYREGSREVSLTYASAPADFRVCSVGPTDHKLAFIGSFDGKEMLNGMISGSPGQLGSVSLKQISKAAGAPADQRERLQAAYSKVAGTYAGQFTSSGSTYDSFPVWIDLLIVDAAVSEYLTCPTLKGQYRRPDLVSNAGSIVLNAQLTSSSPNAGKLVIQSAASNGAGGVTGHTYMKATTHWTASAGVTNFAGPMQWWQYMGQLNATKCAHPNVTRLGKCK